MARDETPCRKVEIRCEMELGLLSKSGEYRIGPGESAGFPKIKGTGPRPAKLCPGGSYVA